MSTQFLVWLDLVLLWQRFQLGQHVIPTLTSMHQLTRWLNQIYIIYCSHTNKSILRVQNCTNCCEETKINSECVNGGDNLWRFNEVCSNANCVHVTASQTMTCQRQVDTKLACEPRQEIATTNVRKQACKRVTQGTSAQLSLIDWLIEHGFTSAPTQYRLYGRRFLHN